MNNILNTKEIVDLKKRLNVLSKAESIAGDKYQKAARDASCYSCVKRGDASKVKVEDLHKQCQNCPHATKVLRLYAEWIDAKHEYESFVDSFSKILYSVLNGKGLSVKTRNGKILPFETAFPGSISTMELKYKKVMVMLVDKDGPYKLL